MKQTPKSKIVVVDDDFSVRSLMKILFEKNNMICQTFERGKDAIAELQQNPNYQLILLDVNMEDENGFDVAAQIKKESIISEIPIIFLTGNTSPEDKRKGFAVGCVDYISKPFDKTEVLMRVNLHLELEQRRKDTLDYAHILEERVQERTIEINQTRKALIISLASLAETRDPETGAHLLRTQAYTRIIAEELSQLDEYKDVLTLNQIHLIVESSPLHDIGKVGIPDHILLKPGRLNDEEFKIMKRHTKIGKDTLDSAIGILGENSFVRIASEIAF
ncbi:MAG: response regulator, partial [Spirochaetes bacterium]|nr:response regulator [Spirochaetota bacterium]